MSDEAVREIVERVAGKFHPCIFDRRLGGSRWICASRAMTYRQALAYWRERDPNAEKRVFGPSWRALTRAEAWWATFFCRNVYEFE